MILARNHGMIITPDCRKAAKPYCVLSCGELNTCDYVKANHNVDMYIIIPQEMNAECASSAFRQLLTTLLTLMTHMQ
jgi:hypothetical protein